MSAIGRGYGAQPGIAFSMSYRLIPASSGERKEA